MLPGLAVVDELRRRGLDGDQLLWIGSSRGQEATLVPAAGLELIGLGGRGIQRRLTVENLRSAWGLVTAVGAALGVFRRRRPRVVLTLGGYASVAASIAAVLFRVPIVVAEQNARAGAANRLIGRFAKSCAVPFAGTDLPRSVVCGNPVRPEILAAAASRDTEAARRSLAMPADRVVLVVFAGSLGSRRINEAVVGLVERWSTRADLHVHHVLGRRDFAEMRDRLPDGAFDDAAIADRISYRAVAYEDRMDLALTAADLVICRAGGTTVAELGVMGVPAILVPLPIATRDHQTANASALVEAGAAILVADGECDTDRLELEVTPILDDPLRRSAMAAAAMSTGRPDAAARVVDLLEAAMR